MLPDATPASILIQHTDSESMRSGWQGRLDLSFERCESRTLLARRQHVGPLLVQKALYPEGPGTCHVAILHPPGGIAAGDDLGVQASLGGGARALLTTPGATKWYRSEGRQARQQCRFSLAEDSVLEWLPRENILFDGSNLSMTLEVELSADAKYFGWDILSFGRRASGERWRRGSLQMDTRIRRAGRTLWLERADILAGSGFAQSPVGLAGFSVCGTFVVAGYDAESALLARCRQVRSPRGSARVGITPVPGLLIARYLGDSVEESFGWFTHLWTVLRPALSGRSACVPRVWAC
jgi:urease accessory protein